MKPRVVTVAVLWGFQLCSTPTSFGQVPLDGWPKEGTNFGYGDPSLVDLDGDGTLEVVVATGGVFDSVIVYRHDGRPAEGWPYEFAEGGPYGIPRVGDMDADGEPEIAIPITASDEIYVFSTNGEVKDGWPIEIPEGISLYDFGMADLDGDRTLELVAVMTSVSRSMYAWHADGSLVEGWPVELEIPLDYDDYDEAYFTDPALGDLDFDGTAEVMVGTYAYLDGDIEVTVPVTVYNGDGTVREGWPRLPPQGAYAHGALLYPAFADFDGDYSCDIYGSSVTTNFLMRNSGDAFRVPRNHGGVPRSPGIGNLDDDLALEIVVPKDELRIYDIDDGLLAATDGPYSRYDGVSIGDADGDGTPEILVWSQRYEDEDGNIDGVTALHLYDTGLEELPGWPIVMDEVTAYGIASTAMGDLDADGDMEIVYTASGVLNVLTMENTGGRTPRVEWQQLGHDATFGYYYHAGNPPKQVLLRGDGNVDAVVDIADAVHLLNTLFATADTDCPVAYDLDVDGKLELEDAVQLLDFLFLGGSSPPMPYPLCGYKPSKELLPCIHFACPPEIAPRPAAPVFDEAPRKRP